MGEGDPRNQHQGRIGPPSIDGRLARTQSIECGPRPRQSRHTASCCCQARPIGVGDEAVELLPFPTRSPRPSWHWNNQVRQRPAFRSMMLCRCGPRRLSPSFIVWQVGHALLNITARRRRRRLPAVAARPPRRAAAERGANNPDVAVPRHDGPSCQLSASTTRSRRYIFPLVERQRWVTQAIVPSISLGVVCGELPLEQRAELPLHRMGSDRAVGRHAILGSARAFFSALPIRYRRQFARRFHRWCATPCGKHMETCMPMFILSLSWTDQVVPHGQGRFEAGSSGSGAREESGS